MKHKYFRLRPLLLSFSLTPVSVGCAAPLSLERLHRLNPSAVATEVCARPPTVEPDAEFWAYDDHADRWVSDRNPEALERFAPWADVFYHYNPSAPAKSARMIPLRFGVSCNKTTKSVPDGVLLAQSVGVLNNGPSYITTADLRRMFGNPKNYVGIRYNQAVGLKFQEVVLANLPGPKVLYANRKRFESQERSRQTNGRIKYVVPDGVAGASVGTSSPIPPVVTTYPECTFVEVKAVKGTIRLSYGQHQIAGMIDVLSRCDAALSQGPQRAYPSLYLIVTGDTQIHMDIVLEAARVDVLVWLSWTKASLNGMMEVTPPNCINCPHVLQGKQVASTLHGWWFGLPTLTATGTGRLDEPILDDQLLGYPGIPGDTSPNP